MSESESSQQFRYDGTWRDKFAVAMRGVVLAVRTQNSFVVHLPLAIVVVTAAVLLRFDVQRLSLIGMLAAFVIVAELFNTALECLARAVTDCENSDVRDALDVASGAVLVASVLATIVGVTLFGVRIWELSSGG